MRRRIPHIAAGLILAGLLTYWLFPPRLNYQRQNDLIGASNATVKSRFGPPDHDATLSAVEAAAGEAGAVIYHAYPREQSEGVLIRRQVWIDGAFWTVVNLHRPEGEWIVLEAYTYNHERLAF